MNTLNLDSMVINTQGLSKTYSSGKASKEVFAIRSLNLQVPRNSIFGFIGPNGAGKTTTIKLLLGLIRPTGGSATVLGYDIAREGLAIRKRIGYLPQEPHFYEHMTARETLRFKARFFYTGPKAEIENRIMEMLELVGLAEKADRPIKGFSGGERQRLGIAQAQINYPELLILDEPAAGLDPLGRRDILELMKRLRAHATIFFSTHILHDVQQVSDRVAILNHGELLAQAPIKELLVNDREKIYCLVIEGDTREAKVRVQSQDWVSGMVSETKDGLTRWQIRVTDDAVAKTRLLRLVLEDRDLVVTEFTQKKSELEDVFVDIIGNNENGDQ